MIKQIFIGIIFLLGISATTSYAQTGFASAVGEEINQVDFYPNPTVDVLTVSIENSNLQQVEIEVYSILGNRLNLSPESLGGNEYRFNVQDLETGYYLLVVRDPETRFRETYKFLKK